MHCSSHHLLLIPPFAAHPTIHCSSHHSLLIPPFAAHPTIRCIAHHVLLITHALLIPPCATCPSMSHSSTTHCSSHQALLVLPRAARLSTVCMCCQPHRRCKCTLQRLLIEIRIACVIRYCRPIDGPLPQLSTPLTIPACRLHALYIYALTLYLP